MSNLILTILQEMIYQYVRMSLKRFGLKLKMLKAKLFSVAVLIDIKNSTIILIILCKKYPKKINFFLIMGDFNVNLLNYESHNDTNDFINTMISHYLLPHILHPTHVTDHSATVIDNISSNNTSYETISGNIISQISDHFPQFIILNHVFSH